MSRAVGSVGLIATIVILGLGLPCHVALGESLPEIRTPKAPPIPHINGPKVYGARPGHPFLYRIPCTGTRPIHFSAIGLPPSLKLDEASGIISGKSPDGPGEYSVTLEAAWFDPSDGMERLVYALRAPHRQRHSQSGRCNDCLGNG